MKNAHELRVALNANFEAIKNDELGVAKAEAMTRVAQAMIASAVAQIRQSHLNKTPSDIAFLREPK